MKLKNFYRDETTRIDEQEKDQLFELERWETYWNLQLSEIKACFDDI